jgi:hypothetical protein
MARGKVKPIDDIVTTHATLRMLVQYGDQALQGKSREEFDADLLRCMDNLMTVRNVVSMVAQLSVEPQEALVQFID